MKKFVVIAEHPPQLCPHSNAAARKQDGEGFRDRRRREEAGDRDHLHWNSRVFLLLVIRAPRV
jgi:hypothetical protein